MSPRDWHDRLEDIVESIHSILEYVSGMDYDSFSQDRKTIDAVLRNLEIIGEASTFIPLDVRESYPEFPLVELRAMRNIIVHQYFGVSLPIIWKTIKEDLPDLEEVIKNISGYGKKI